MTEDILSGETNAELQLFSQSVSDLMSITKVIPVG